MQLLLLAWIIADTSILVAHYGFGAMDKGTIIEGDEIMQAKSYVIVRSSSRIMMTFIMLLMFLWWACISRKVIRVIRKEQSMKKMRSQLYIFMIMFLSQFGFHLVGNIISTYRWLYFSLQFSQVKIAMVKLGMETFMIVQIFLELILDLWLIIYIQQKDDHQAEHIDSSS